MIWLCITLVSVTSVISGQNINTSQIKVFPALNQSIAGVFQVTYLNYNNQPEYAFNASQARQLCLSLGMSIASKAQVEEALRRGLETCRFGWIDEHFVVIPRIKAASNCGRNRIGLITWRVLVNEKFDVFCFNESGAVRQVENPTTSSPLSSREYSSSTLTTYSTSYSYSSVPPTYSSPTTTDSEVEPAHSVSRAQGSPGVKVIVIISACAILLVAVIILAFLKLRRRCPWNADMKQKQPEDIETEEWKHVKNIKETKKDAQEDETIKVGVDAS
uniref:lymphatic vessel endothelial hyaluronic acid receptor 1a n=1 Tax=Monopterus albus TaxID=43700 RepID=UPI0009B4BE9F|nr:lymphatic vessel endothelial hyaluronic acid receptor 1 [Monopterus albus]